MLVFMFVLVLVFMLVVVVVVIVIVIAVLGQIVADSTTCRAAQSSADQATGGTTNTVADYLATRCTEPPANG